MTHQISSAGSYQVCLLCDLFCLGRKLCHQIFTLTSIDFSGNRVFPPTAKFDPHNLHSFLLLFGDRIDAVNVRGKK